MKGRGLVEELEYTKDVLDAVVKLDKLGDSTNDEGELLAGFASIMRDKIPCKGIVLLMFSEKGELKPVGTQGDVEFDISKCEKVCKDFEIVKEGNSMFVPLGLEKAQGVFVLQGRDFTPIDEKLADAIESQADSILEHARTFKQLEHRAKELEVLYKIDQIRDTVQDFDKMLDEVLSEIITVIKSGTGFIVLYNKKGEVSEVKLKGGDSERLGDAVKNIAKDTVSAQKLTLFEGLEGVKDAMCIPLILEKNIIGVFGVLNSAEEGFSKQDERILTAIASQADTAIFEDQKKRRIKDVFKRYVNENVVDQMLDTEDEDFLSGVRKDMSVLFCDVRGFTAFSERTEAHKLVDYINMYLAAMTEVIMKHNATLDKFVGDEVMALFGAPISISDHAVRAVQTAIDMQKAMKEVQAYWRSLGEDELKVGIGINSGLMVAGNIGCEKMADYTVLGDNVNLAARLCSKAPGDKIIISKSTYDLVKDKFECRALEPIMVKGKKDPVEIFEVVY